MEFKSLDDLIFACAKSVEHFGMLLYRYRRLLT